MESDKQTFIDKYIADELSQEEKISFEKMLEEDESLRKELMLTRHIMTSFERKGERKAVDELAQFSSKEELRSIIEAAEKTDGKKRRVRKMIITLTSAAAMILLVLYLGLQPYYKNEMLFDAYFSTGNYDITPFRSSLLPTQEQAVYLNQAIDFYRNGDYKAASDHFERSVAGMPQQDIPEEITFYLAICYMETGNTEKAIPLFEYLYQNGAEYKEDAQWNLALAFIKEGRKKQAKEMLIRLSDTDTPYAIKAEELLKKMNKRRWF